MHVPEHDSQATEMALGRLEGLPKSDPSFAKASLFEGVQVWERPFFPVEDGEGP
jgi:hypothetical protein